MSLLHSPGFLSSRSADSPARRALHCRTWYVAMAVTASLLFAAPAGAAELSLGGVALLYNGPNGQRSALRYAADLGLHQRLQWVPARVGLGLRAGGPLPADGAPLEGYLQAGLAPVLGRWQPQVGFELGYSGFAELPLRKNYPVGSRMFSKEHIGGGYVAVNLEPLRFSMGPLFLSALELQLGTTIAYLGETARLQLGLLRIGGSL